MIQDLFVDLWGRRESLDVTTSAEVYLFTALRYKIYNYIRAQLVRKAHVDHLLRWSPEVGSPVEDQVYYEELARAVEASVARLPEKYRRVYVLSRQENRTYREIAELLNLPPDTVEKQMSRALQLMRIHLHDYLVSALLVAGSLPLQGTDLQ